MSHENQHGKISYPGRTLACHLMRNAGEHHRTMFRAPVLS
ncbi:hypothetical protein IWX85_002109 [Polaromonas sp. CG_9.11]|nr:hypothetical protein [Polaromonas sp. CG_9.11]